MVEKGHITLDSSQSTLNYAWEIENFQYLYHLVHHKIPTTTLKSPIFSTPHSDNAKQWQILFCPKNPNSHFQKFSSIFLQYFGKDEVAFRLEFSYFHKGGTHTVLSNTRKMGMQLFNPQNARHGYEEFFDRSNYLSLETIGVHCRIVFDSPLTMYNTILGTMRHTIDNKGGSSVHSSSQDDCQSNFHKLFETELLADVTVNIGQKKKSLHKAILASHSDVFRAMFEHDMIEKANNVVNVVDISLDVAMEMFRYMYTGKVNNIEKLPVNELLIAAEKYAVTGLKAMCEKTLVKNLNFDNALQYLTLASVHNSPDLKAKVMEFIVKHLDKFVDKPQFKLLDQNIVCEVLSAVAKNKY